MLGAVASNPDFSPGLIGLELVGPEEIFGKAVDSWDKCDCQSVVTAQKGGLSDDRVYPRGFAFTGHFSRRVVAEFSAQRVSSDGGALLLREVDRRINLLGRLARCFTDGRDASRSTVCSVDRPVAQGG
jgi:Transposase DDE domain group 1